MKIFQLLDIHILSQSCNIPDYNATTQAQIVEH